MHRLEICYSQTALACRYFVWKMLNTRNVTRMVYIVVVLVRVGGMCVSERWFV